MKKIGLFLCITVLSVVTVAFAQKNNGQGIGKTQAPNILGDFKYLQVNNLSIPFGNNGIIADVGDSLPGPLHGRWGEYPAGSDLHFLYWSSFWVSGFIDGELWASAVSNFPGIRDYIAGTYGSHPADTNNKIFTVTSQDGAGSDAYIEWANAVAAGADYVDLDGDGFYNANVDMPDLLGDRMLWFAMNDGTDIYDRHWAGSKIVGMEVQVTAWAFAARAGALANTIFVRYRLVNKSADTIEDMYFTSQHNPDLGDYADDLVGCDIELGAGFTYNDGPDRYYGVAPPAFLVDFLQGPAVSSPGDTARLVLGPNLGVKTLRDHKILGLSSFSQYLSGDASLRYPGTQQIARFYQLGLMHDGSFFDPLSRGAGGNSTDDPHYWYSGDPVSGTGWLQYSGDNQYMLLNTGPFRMEPGDKQDIVVAFIVGQGTEALNSITKAKEISKFVQKIYEANFKGPVAPQVISRSGEDELGRQFIDLFWDAADYVAQRDKRTWGEQQFEGFQVRQFHSPVPTDSVNGMNNVATIAQFDLKNNIGDLYEETGQGRLLKIRAANNLDSLAYSSPDGAYLHLRVTEDAFTKNRVRLGAPYYFEVVVYNIDHSWIHENENTTRENDWVLPFPNALLKSRATEGANFVEVIPGADENLSYPVFAQADHTNGTSGGTVLWEVILPQQLTGHDYEVSFALDPTLGIFWRLTDLTTQETILDRQVVQSGGYNFPVVDGIMVRVYSPPADSSKGIPNGPEDRFVFYAGEALIEKITPPWAEQFDRVNVFPNPYFAHNSQESALTAQQFVTFTHLPNQVRIRIYSIAGKFIREYNKNDVSPFLRWDLKRRDGKRAASGIYLAHITAPEFNLQKVLKVAIVQRRL